MPEVEFSDEAPGLLARLLAFLYCGFYPRQMSDDSDRGPSNNLRSYFGQLNFVDSSFSVGDDFELELKLHVSMYAVGDRFLATELKEFSLRKFCQTWNLYCNENRVFYRCKHDRDHSAVITSSLAEIVYYKAPESDRGLKDLLVTHMLRNYRTSNQEYASMGPYKGLLLAVPDLAYDMLTHHLRDTRMTCTRCTSKSFSIIRRHCTCVSLYGHTKECEANDKKKRTCTGCGNQGCLELADPPSP